MTPEERNLVTDLFDRLATLEDVQRDAEAERLIRDGLRQAPNALYALVQTVLVQDEALKRADARIRELEGDPEPPARDSSFLGGVRDTLFGRSESRGSVPSVRSGEAAAGTSGAWEGAREGARQAMPGAPAPGASSMSAPGSAPGSVPGSMGGSFLGTAAAAAAGVIGGSLLLGGIRNAMGGAAPGGHGALDPNSGGAGSPWSGGSSGGELSRQAGLDDIGRTPSSASRDSSGESGHGLLGDRGSDEPTSDDDADDVDDNDDFDDDFDSDLGDEE